MESICQWPDCKKAALCRSGNVHGALVCSDHFKITNGAKATSTEIWIMSFMAQRERANEFEQRHLIGHNTVKAMTEKIEGLEADNKRLERELKKANTQIMELTNALVEAD